MTTTIATEIDFDFDSLGIDFCEDKAEVKKPQKKIDPVNKNLSYSDRKARFLNEVNKAHKPVITDDQFSLSNIEYRPSCFLANGSNSILRQTDNIPHWRLRGYGNFQIAIFNEGSNGVRFGKNHSLVAMVRYRILPSTNWLPLGVISVVSNKLVFKCREITKLIDSDPAKSKVLLHLLREFGLVPNLPIADVNLPRIPNRSQRDYCMFSVDDLQNYLGLKLNVSDNPTIPYTIESDCRPKMDRVRETPVVEVKRYGSTTKDLRDRVYQLERQLKRKERQLKEASKQADRYHSEAVKARYGTR